jgi:alpha-beta hydrolase superfamily lysophospholipase
MSNEIALDLTCSDPTAVASMAADPLIRHVATPRWFNEVRATQARLRASATLLKVPTFMAVAGEDRLVDSAAAIAFAHAAGPIVDLKVYETLFHEMYLERDRGLVIADVVDWLTRRFGASRATSGRA